MSRITVTVFKDGLALEAELNKSARQLAKKKGIAFHNAMTEVERTYDPITYTQVIHSDSKELDLKTLGQHIANGAPHEISRAS